jgi:His/Glu/Gln/Arg/opine family amino acid ABC transporter permease subunit
MSIIPYIPYIVWGLQFTVLVSLAAFAIGLALGLAIAMARLSGGRIANGLLALYVTVFRSLPEVLTILFVYYGIDLLLRSVTAAAGLAPISFSPFLAAAAAIGLQFAAYCSEIFRDAYRAIPAGQIEAGHALGMMRGKVFTRILLPLMLRNALPSLGNIFLVILKASALASVIGLEEVTRRAKVAAGSVREPIGAFAVAAVCFLLLTAVAGALQHRLERGRLKQV